MSREAGNIEELRQESPKGRRTESVKLKEEIEQLKERLKEEEEKNTAYLTQIKYLQADYENCMKRTQRETERISKYGNERLITNLLEILDELELASDANRDEPISEEVRIGVRMTLEKLKTTLAKEGLTAIECENKPFDPTMHQAISKEYCEDHDEGLVLRELRKGYLLGGKVIRQSTVVVSSSKPSLPKK